VTIIAGASLNEALPELQQLALSFLAIFFSCHPSKRPRPFIHDGLQ